MRADPSTGRTTHSLRAAKPRTGIEQETTHRRCRSEGTRRSGAARLRRAWLPLLGLLLLSALPAFAAPTAWVVPSLVRVGPTAAAGTATSIDVYAAKGEAESVQIIVTAPTSGALSNVNVSVPSLGGAQVTLYREYYVYLPTGSPNYATNLNPPGGPGWYPDGLVPFTNPATGLPLTGGAITGAPFSVSAGQNQPVWVDITVPRTQAAGAYSGVFTVTSDQGNASVTVNLHVWNFTLPVKPAEQSAFLIWNNPQNVQWEQELLENRIMPESDNTSAERSLIDQYGLGATTMPFWSSADPSTNYIAPAPSVSQFQQAASQHQPDIMKYDYMADEIGWDTALYPTIQQWAYNMHQAGINNLITMAPDPLLYDDGSGTGRSAVDIWVMLPKMYDQVPDRVNYVISKGDQAWSYNCLQQDDYSPKWLFDMAPINYRIQGGFINQSLGLTGLLYWRVDWWTSDPWNNVYAWSAYPGEGMLVYPGDQVGLPGSIVPSMRLKYLRDGMDDYDYIDLLKKAGQGAWALQVAATVGPDWTNWTRDPNVLEAARRQLGAKLDSLGGGSGGDPTETVTVTASVSPTTVASGGTSSLAASAVDSLGNPIAAWSWSDGGAGGEFSSATAQNPTYTAPTNTSGSNKSVALSVTATASGTTPVSGQASTLLTVQTGTVAHTLTATASASPSTVASGGSVALTATAVDSQNHTGFAWKWSDNGAGGTFSSTTTQDPTWKAPANTSASPVVCTLTVTAICEWYWPWITATASVPVTVTGTGSVTHTLSVTASASPATVASGGTTSLSASATDSLGHSVNWVWSDGGAGGTFSSVTVQNPTYTAPVNTSGASKTVTLTATATCTGSPSLTQSASVPITVQTVPHTLVVTASASPATIASGATSALTATATDSLGYSVASWSWSDGGAGGTFSATTAQNPTYTAPANTSGANEMITLTVTALSGGSPAVSASASVTVAEQSATITVAHTVTATASASPTVMASGGSTVLTATAVDSQNHTGLAWQWTDSGAGGTFSPSATVQNPTYLAPVNTSGAPKTVTLTVKAICEWYYPWVTGSASVAVTVNSTTTTTTTTTTTHTLSVTATASSGTVARRGKVTLTATPFDSQGHTGEAWQWTDNGAGGKFSSTTAQNPTYTAPSTAKTVTLTVKSICEWYWPWITATANVPLSVQ